MGNQVNWDKIDSMIENIQDNQTKGQPIANQNPDEIPVKFLDTKEITGAEASITMKIVCVKNVPIFKCAFHYPLTSYLNNNQKFVCKHETIELDSNGEPCIPCQLIESKRFQKLRQLSWSIRDNNNGMLDNYDAATQEFMLTQAKDVLNFRPIVFYYLTFVKVPYDGTIYIFRSFEQEAAKILMSLKENKEKGNKMFDWKKGYNSILTLERKSSSPYMTVKSFEVVDKQSALTKDKDVVKKIETFLADFDIFKRMKISAIDTDDQKKLTKKWLELKEQGMKRCGYVWNKEDQKYDFIGLANIGKSNSNVEESKEEEEPSGDSNPDEPNEDFNVDEVLGELDDLDL